MTKILTYHFKKGREMTEKHKIIKAYIEAYEKHFGRKPTQQMLSGWTGFSQAAISKIVNDIEKENRLKIVKGDMT